MVQILHCRSEVPSSSVVKRRIICWRWRWRRSCKLPKSWNGEIDCLGIIRLVLQVLQASCSTIHKTMFRILGPFESHHQKPAIKSLTFGSKSFWAIFSSSDGSQILWNYIFTWQVIWKANNLFTAVSTRMCDEINKKMW